MLTRLDHAILAVNDLGTAATTFERLGFRVAPGGEHPGWGTHNSIVRFGLDYLELVAVTDPALAATNSFGRAVLRELETGEGWMGYVVATTDAEAEAAELVRRGVAVDGPVAGSRLRPDGVRLEWRNLGLGPLFEQRMLPLLIQHLPDDEQRLRRFEQEGALGGHPLGARGLRSVTLAVRNLEAALKIYLDELGLRPTGYEENAWVQSSAAWLQLGSDVVILAAPASDRSPLAAELEQRGEGPFCFEVEVDDLHAALRHVGQAGFGAERIGTGRTVMVGPQGLHGARIALSQG